MTNTIPFSEVKAHLSEVPPPRRRVSSGSWSLSSVIQTPPALRV
ncbi:MAG: hypothetical protein OXF00_04395 [bacterium]|nr:hypothetical protein [bacterium]